jgi:hypothetical protein
MRDTKSCSFTFKTLIFTKPRFSLLLMALMIVADVSVSFFEAQLYSSHFILRETFRFPVMILINYLFSEFILNSYHK